MRLLPCWLCPCRVLWFIEVPASFTLTYLPGRCFEGIYQDTMVASVLDSNDGVTDGTSGGTVLWCTVDIGNGRLW